MRHTSWSVPPFCQALAAPETHVVTNNHYRGQAITNAVMLESMIAGERVAAPPGVAAEYADVLAPYLVR